MAKVTSPNRTLNGTPNWQMTSSTSGKVTGNDDAAEGDVIYAGNGLSAANFPDDTAGKVVMMDYTTNAANRNTAVSNAVTRGAVAVILAHTGNLAAPPAFTLQTPQPTVPVVGGGRAHGDWIKELLAGGPLRLRIATNRYVTPMGSNVIGIRKAVGDPEGDSAPIVMAGAHIDTVLGAPGAHDDGSGNGTTMEIARVISQFPTDKEIRIGGFGGEEGGLLGASAYVATLTAAERARFIGEWQMDMVGTPHEPARFWALTPNGVTNFVVDQAYAAAARADFSGMRNCRLGQSDHQAFYNAGIPAALFIWLDYRPPTPPAICGPTGGTYQTEPQYHLPTDTMDNISQERLQVTLDVVGGALIHNAFNQVSVTSSNDGAPVDGGDVNANCGDGWRDLGDTSAAGTLATVIPHATCDFRLVDGTEVSILEDVEVSGDRTVAFTEFVPILGLAALAPATDSLNSTLPEAFRNVARAAGSVDEVSVYVENGTTAPWLIAGIYADANGHPGQLLGQSDTLLAAGGWNKVAIPPVALADGRPYWIAVMGAGGVLKIRTYSGGQGTQDSETGRAGRIDLPATWRTGRVFKNDGPASAYAG